jgi:hypothetical protein
LSFRTRFLGVSFSQDNSSPRSLLLGMFLSQYRICCRAQIHAGSPPDRYLRPQRSPILASAKQLHNHHVVIHLQRPPSRLVAVTPVAVRSLGKRADLSLAALRSNSTLATLRLPVNELTSCRFATSQGHGRCGSAVLPASGGKVPPRSKPPR